MSESLVSLQNQVNSLEEIVTTLNQKISRFDIDSQIFLRKNPQIKPGIGMKLSYDSNGLVTGSKELVTSDIPELSIEKIKGLRAALNEKASQSDLKTFSINPDDIMKKDTIVGSGVKFQYDRHGLIVSTSDLTEEDIPELSMSKITGLQDMIASLKGIEKEVVEEDKFRVSPGTGVKVTYDEKGRITTSQRLSMDDLPNELLTTINEIRSQVSTFASQQVVSRLSNEIVEKLDRNKPITPGQFTKVRVDSNGLVTEGDKLTENDLPDLSIRSIQGLTEALRNKAEQSEFAELSTSVYSLTNTLNKFGDISSLNNSIAMKAEATELREVKNLVLHLQENVNMILDSFPTNLIQKQLEEISTILSDLSGRVSVLETKLK